MHSKARVCLPIDTVYTYGTYDTVVGTVVGSCFYWVHFHDIHRRVKSSASGAAAVGSKQAQQRVEHIT